MSWCGGGEISATPGCVCRRRAISRVTLWPGSWPPSPGFEPCAILICSSWANAAYSAVTPKRPDAICLIRELRSVRKRAGSSPPSPQFERAPSRLNAVAIVSCASAESAPCDMPPDEQRRRCRARALERLALEVGECRAADGPRRPGKRRLDERAVETERIEDLRAAVAGDVRDPHLGHHLQDAVLDRLLEAELCLNRIG